MKSAVISEIGRRPEMEDAYYLDMDFAGKGWLFGGIYDGHTGNYAACYASERLHKEFLSSLEEGASPQEAFLASYRAVSVSLSRQGSGTTAVNFFMREDELFTANVGDARAIIIGDEKTEQLTVDHRVDNPEERKRIEESGGRIEDPYVLKGLWALMPTRVLGDEYFRSVGIIPRPFVGMRRISAADRVLLAACDGLFDVMTNEEVADFERNSNNLDDFLKALEAEALHVRKGGDNLTIVAVDLRERG